MNAEQRGKLQSLQTAAKEAGKLFSDGKFIESAEKVTSVQKELLELLESKDPAILKEGKKTYLVLQKAHELLELEGATLEPLPTWAELSVGAVKATTKGKPDKLKDGVSFKDDIAPWLITECGSCHIAKRSGEFSMATYNDLMRGSKAGRVLIPGKDIGNPMVESIESRDMPRGNGSVSRDQLDALKRWIAEGAKFDGPNPTAPLTSFSRGAKSNAAMETEKGPAKPTGKETVSFARDVAPILIANCTGCHINVRQVQGNLRMDDFTQLLRGGNSGSIISPGKPDDSLLIKKLKGESGNRMPAGGRPPLSDEKIAMIAKWIAEKATFDGYSPDADIDGVVDRAIAANSNHEELFKKRQERAANSWAKVLPNDKAKSVSNHQMVILGNVPQERLAELLTVMEKAKEHVAKQFGISSSDPLVKGGLAVFVLKSRYDYSEFGKMTEQRELPREWQGHWHSDPLDVYAVIADDSTIDEKQQLSVAIQVLTGAYLGSFSGVPNWFAEGVARNQVLLANRRGDNRTKSWQMAMPAAVRKVDKPQTLLEGKIDEESSGLVGMGLTAFMMDRANKRRFEALISGLKAGKDFDEAMQASFGPPEKILRAFLGK
jgi:mono/diheme cytochrome c family protein